MNFEGSIDPLMRQAWSFLRKCAEADYPMWSSSDGWYLQVGRLPRKVRQAPPDFDLGDHVIIKPLEDCPGRVVSMGLDHGGWTVVVRYFHNGDAKTLKTFPDEIERKG